MKILILEENQQQASIINDLLANQSNLHIDVAKDISQASCFISCINYDLFFFDVIYYQSEGIFFFSKIDRCQVPTGVVITSIGNEDVKNLICDMCLAAGFDFAISSQKPVDIQCVEQAILKIKSKKERKNSSRQIALSSLSKEDVEEGLENGYFLNYYQPQYCTTTNKLVSVEALIRYEHPDLGVFRPDSFLCSFDLNKLFWFVLERSLRDISELSFNINLSVNINQRTLKSPISERLLFLCYSYGFEPSRLTLELTEDEAFDPDVISLANLTALRLAGVGLAIDDFGTGHSSLSQLVTLPYTELKVDQKFICNLVKNFKSRQVLATSLFLAKSLKMKSVAEGVEDQETLSYISSAGIELYQGYFGSKPLPIEKLALMEF